MRWSLELGSKPSAKPDFENSQNSLGDSESAKYDLALSFSSISDPTAVLETVKGGSGSHSQ